VHYLDITGEINVFLAAQRRHADAQAAGIVICPGVGFDVIPTNSARRVLHAEHAPGPALRRTIARVDFHPRGVASEAADR
jgi:short subunit dehydrogenase-like uncharacterized protein